MSLADFKAKYKPAPVSSATIGVPGKTYVAKGSGPSYVGPTPKGADKGIFAGSSTPLGTSLAGSNLSKGNVANAALLGITVGGSGAARSVAPSAIRMATRILPDEIARVPAAIRMATRILPEEIGRVAGSKYLQNAISQITSKPANVGGAIQKLSGNVFTELGSFPGKQTFIQTPARTAGQIAGTTKSLITKAENQASTIAGYVSSGAKTGIKTGIKIGATGGAGAGALVGYLIGSNKDKKKK